jgi:hypothetical protein
MTDLALLWMETATFVTSDAGKRLTPRWHAPGARARHPQRCFGRAAQRRAFPDSASAPPRAGVSRRPCAAPRSVPWSMRAPTPSRSPQVLPAPRPPSNAEGGLPFPVPGAPKEGARSPPPYPELKGYATAPGLFLITSTPGLPAPRGIKRVARAAGLRAPWGSQ